VRGVVEPSSGVRQQLRSSEEILQLIQNCDSPVIPFRVSPLLCFSDCNSSVFPEKSNAAH
jgi:hypothetical protein